MPVRAKISWLSFSVLFVAVGCTKKDKNVEPFRKISPSEVEIQDKSHIGTSKVELKNFPFTLEVPGKIAISEKDYYMLSARVAGRIEQISVSVGDAVEKGSEIGRAHV